jgi:glycosyltransferase involved in cell wall biosynthesis
MKADTQPCVSIGVPVFNGEPFLAAALDSILGQTYEHFELIVCDNASTDATAEICRHYAARDQRVRYYRNAQHVRVQANFHRVLELASADYFMWTAADDVRPPNAVEVLLATLVENAAAVMAYGSILLRTDGREQLARVAADLHMAGLPAAGRVRAFTQQLTHNAVFYGLYRRAAAVQGTLGYHYGNDYLYCLQMCLLGPFTYTPAPVLIHRRPEWPDDPLDNPRYGPMYGNVPVTLKNLAQPSPIRRKKSWTVVFMGAYYLATSRGTPWADRVGAVAVHVWTFGSRYRVLLAKEAAYHLCRPAFWVAELPSRVGRWLRRGVGRSGAFRRLVG